MTTRATIDGYFAALRSGEGWQTHLADDVRFTSFTAPRRELVGREAYVAGTRRFYGTIQSFQVRQLLVDGDRAVALTTYQLRPPTGAAFSSDVAEVFGVRDGKIAVFDIYFDSAPFPK
jgi:ketosteroid isomerase-like protein